MSYGVRFLALCGLMSVGASFAAQATHDAANPYHVTDIIVGSVLPQPIINGPLPFDSSYAALTPDQKAVLFDDYESLSPGDEPPFPLYGIRHLIKPLIPFAEIWSPTGPLVASVEVNSKGDAVAVTIYKSPDPQLSRVASGALAFEKYKPASCKGQPCTMQYVLHLDFPQRWGAPVQEVEFKRYDPMSGEFSRR